MATPAKVQKRACDQCNYRRVKCSGVQPCQKCTTSHLNCTFEKAAKGRTGKRIHALKETGADAVAQPSQSPPWDSPNSAIRSPISQSSNLQPDLNPAGPSNLLGSQSSTSPFPPVPSVLTHLPHPAMLPPLNMPLADNFLTSFGAAYDGSEIGSMSPGMQSNAFPFSWPLDLPTEIWSSWLTDPDAVTTPLDALQVPRPEQTRTPSEDESNHTLASQDLLLGEPEDEPLSDSNLIPLVSIFFERVHPIMPVFTRSWLLGRVDNDEHKMQLQFSAMLLALSAMALIQPLRKTERHMRKHRLQKARNLLDTCAKSGSSTMLGQDPTLDAVLTSFYMFACLFGLQEHGAASFRLREAVTLGKLMRLHIPTSYHSLPADERERRLRTFWLLCITERAYALQGGESIGFSGLPFDIMQDLTSLIHANRLQDFPVDHLKLFSYVDSDFIECWHGRCRGHGCSRFTGQRALQLHAALDGTDLVPSTPQTSKPAQKRTSSYEREGMQNIDTVITRQWLHIRVWQTCLTHGLLSNDSQAYQLSYGYALEVAQQALQSYLVADAPSRDAHGIGLFSKLRDIALVLASCVRHLPLSPHTGNVLDQYQSVLSQGPDDTQSYAEELQTARNH